MLEFKGEFEWNTPVEKHQVYAFAEFEDNGDGHYTYFHIYPN